MALIYNGEVVNVADSALVRDALADYLEVQGDTTASLRLTELDQADPAGRYRLLVTGDRLLFQRAATASWATATTLFAIDATGAGISYPDDTVLALGSDEDAAFVLRSTALGANTALANVLVGTPVAAATPANSLLISNITADGDIALFTVNAAGANSIEALRIDASAGLIVFNEAGADWDFRVEGDNNATLFDTDGGTDSLSMGAAVAAGAFLTVSPYAQARTLITSVGGGLHVPAGTFTDDGAARTVAIIAAHFFGIPTFTNAANAVTGTDTATVYIAGTPVAGANWTSTRPYALFVDAGVVRVDGTFQLGLAGGTTGVMNLQGATSGVVTITVAAAAGTYTLTLPTDDGTATQYLETDGAGILRWRTLAVRSSGAAFDMIIATASVFTAERTLTINPGDAARTLTLGGDATLNGGTHSGTNTGDQTITLTGDVTGSGTGSFAATIATAAVTLAKMADIATARFIGRTTAATGVPEALTTAQATALLDAATATLKGMVPTPPNNTTTFLRGDATFAAPAGGTHTSGTTDVTTSETTTSTTYTDLATSGPAVTLSPGGSTTQLIYISGNLENSVASAISTISVSIAGAAATDTNGAAEQSPTAARRWVVGRWNLASAVANASTHTAKYKVDTGTGTFLDRRVIALTLT